MNKKQKWRNVRFEISQDVIDASSILENPILLEQVVARMVRAMEKEYKHGQAIAHADGTNAVNRQEDTKE